MTRKQIKNSYVNKYGEMFPMFAVITPLCRYPPQTLSANSETAVEDNSCNFCTEI